MNKEELILFIRENDPYFTDAKLEQYDEHELLVIKISIEGEKWREEILAIPIIKQ